MPCDKVAINVFFDNTCTYFQLITEVFLTCSNTTPTITIFVSLLFDKAMVKLIMGDSQWEH